MPQDRVYFVADVHLPRHGSPAHPLNQAWCAWCDALLENPTQALYILGDLFEAYVGDDDLDAYQDSLNPLLALHQAGSDIFFMPGNRDFLVGEVFYSRYPIVHLGDDSACVQHW
ncbi:MAG: metallophosphoesterase, partial [Moraxella osloensis]|nr:metallophosphoesterase [Moraxella osloensis]